jgi:glycosyltransferase involved in cell wall biosynthesis
LLLHHSKNGYIELNVPFLTIIIPAFNEEHRLPLAMEQSIQFLEKQDYDYELVVVENGSQDKTYQIAKEYAARYPQIRVIKETTPGKGLAVKRGMLESQGEYRFMCDVDFSMPIIEINKFLPPELVDFDIAIASREAPGAVRYYEPLYRHLGGRMINLMIRLLALPGLDDTQCGFKCFRGPVAEVLFSHQTMTGWSFDVEILMIASRFGYHIVEIPISWYFSTESKVNPFINTLQFARDLWKLRRNAQRGLYNQINRGKVNQSEAELNIRQ